jgi:hypothetical protein
MCIRDRDMIEAHNNVVAFLFPSREIYEQEVVNGNIQIDYFVCHADVQEVYDGPGFENSTIVSTILVNEETMFNKVHNGTNEQMLARIKPLFKKMYRSYINSIQLHKRTTKNFYDMVIGYDPCLRDFKIEKKKDFNIENEFFYTSVIEPRWLKINYNVFVCSPATFMKIVNFWHFLKIVADATFKIWEFVDKVEDPDKFVFPMWLSMQTIKIRRIEHEL